jgi:hypothetical protein
MAVPTATVTASKKHACSVAELAAAPAVALLHRYETLLSRMYQRALRNLPPSLMTRVEAYWPKYPKISTTRCVGSLANALIKPLVAGTIAMFEVIAPSNAFSVATRG